MGECPTCPIPSSELHTGEVFPPRDVEPILDALRMIEVGLEEFAAACKEVKIKAVQHPFWEDLPYVNIYRSITPDVLHQLYQGLVKHLVKWLKHIYGTVEIDARCRRMPLSSGIRLFHKGITGLQRVSGAEHADICRVLLGLIVDLRLPGGESPVRIVKATRALLDFLYLARYPVHSTETLNALDQAWTSWHENKVGFGDINQNFPKAHNPGHYRLYIELFGTTDNYNTESTERLHIDLAKDAYKATNHKDEFPQMVMWLERREKVWRHDQHIRVQLGESFGQPVVHRQHIVLSKHPSVYAVPLDDLADKYGADDIINALVTFVTTTNHPTFAQRQIQTAASQVHLPMASLPVYHKVRISNPDQHNREDVSDVFDSVHAHPARHDARGRLIAGRFDTVLIDTDQSEANTSVSRFRVAQVRAIFSLRKRDRELLFQNVNEHDIGNYFAYVEWFSKFPAAPNSHHRMYKVSRSYAENGFRLGAVVPLERIKCSVQLFPMFGSSITPRGWTSGNVLEECPSFYVNPFGNDYVYSLL